MRKIPDEEVKSILLTILVKVDFLCRNNGLKYFLFGGTLIGAIRHKGFIPWDDDIDIAMPRKDYCKLINVLENNNLNLKFFSYEKDKKFPYCYGKISDTTTILYEKDYQIIENLGINIDVFPLDFQGKNEYQAKKLVMKMRILNAFLVESNLTSYHRISKKWYYEIPKFFMYPLAKLLGKKFWIHKMNLEAQRYNQMDCTYLGCNIDPNFHTIFDKQFFEHPIDVEFEGCQFMAPCGYDKILRINYGDYMLPPPESKRVSHHNFEAFYKDKT